MTGQQLLDTIPAGVFTLLLLLGVGNEELGLSSQPSQGEGSDS